MKPLLIIFAIVLCCMTGLDGQFSVLPRSGEGRVLRAESATFWQDPQHLVPSIFWSPAGLDAQIERKWWRKAPILPTLSKNGLKPILTATGEVIWAEPIIEGFLNLYREPVQVDVNNQAMTNTDLSSVYNYWIGKRYMVKITNSNYKEVVKDQLTGAKDLHRKLGKVGFRFENLPSMVLYYNHFFSTEPLQVNRLSKNDLLLK